MPCCGGIARAAVVTTAWVSGGVHMVTLYRFDHKTGLGSYSGPFIPCERRLRFMEI